MNKFGWAAFMGTVIFTGGSLLAAEEEDGGITVQLTPSGFVSLREGQVVKGGIDNPQEAKHPQTDHVWVQELYTGFQMQTAFNPLPLIGRVGLEMKICNEYPRYRQDFGKSRRLYFYPYLSRADLTYEFGSAEDPFLSLDLGYFPFKYNNDARNLGEYMFRSGTYPQYLITEYDFPLARLLGVHASGKLPGSISWDVLATTNIEWSAIGDLNLSGFLSFKPSPLIEVGAGAGVFSLVSMDDNYTTPKIKDATDYLTRRNDGGFDTSWYTFAGTKLMARASLDPKALFPSLDVFGKEDLKLFAEAAVLGVKNYDTGIPTPSNGRYIRPDPSRPDDSVFIYFVDYSDIKKRVPVMFGFNIPAFKFLDVLSLQFEWFGSEFPNDMTPVVIDGQPIPLASYNGKKDGYSPEKYRGDNWKWSLYGSKILLGHFQLSLQFARDHMRWYRMSFSEQDWEEALREPGDWYWTAKIGYFF
jgi:hypothetical protein